MRIRFSLFLLLYVFLIFHICEKNGDGQLHRQMKGPERGDTDLLIVWFPLLKQGSNVSVYLRGNLIITETLYLKEGKQLLEFISVRIIFG